MGAGDHCNCIYTTLTQNLNVTVGFWAESLVYSCYILPRRTIVVPTGSVSHSIDVIYGYYCPYSSSRGCSSCEAAGGPENAPEHPSTIAQAFWFPRSPPCRRLIYSVALPTLVCSVSFSRCGDAATFPLPHWFSLPG